MNIFVIYDLIFLALFTIGVGLFLYTRKHNLKRQGLLYLYRTKFGIKFIDTFTNKYKKILKPMQYLVLLSGYILMILMIWFLFKFSWLYVTSPTAAAELKVPVVVPLVPYLPELFNIDFLPPFYFTYWIIIIAIIAIPHEFAHGIFARLNKIKIHSTGFGFLGPFLAAFVEPDEKQTAKASKFAQLSVLAAGTFANVLATVFFLVILWLFFISAFVPAGVNFNSYSTSLVNVSSIEEVGGIPMQDLSLIDLPEGEFLELMASGNKYYTNKITLEGSLSNNLEVLPVYEDTPAFNKKITGAISTIDGKEVRSYEDLGNILEGYSPGDNVAVTTIDQDTLEVKSYNLELGEKEGKAFLGVGIALPQRSGVMGTIYNIFAEVKDPSVFYRSNIGPIGTFIYDLLWWTVIISISVALVNMLPVGIFDGGRFFYLTIWGLTKSEKIGRRAFATSTWLILLIIVAMMVKWALIFV